MQHEIQPNVRQNSEHIRIWTAYIDIDGDPHCRVRDFLQLPLWATICRPSGASKERFAPYPPLASVLSRNFVQRIWAASGAKAPCVFYFLCQG